MQVYGTYNPKGLPRTAGLAKLSYVKEAEPKRDGSHIILPSNNQTSLYLVRDGAQFIFRHRVSDYDASTWFGGTDEQPFLTRLRDEAWKAFTQSGYDGLVAYLVPSVTRKLERDFGLNWQRQGDFFATPIPEELATLEKLESLVLGRGVEARKQSNEPLNSTRHRFSGYCLTLTALLGLERPTIYQGRLEAPDHQPLELKSPHFLLQALGLADPKKAD